MPREKQFWTRST